MSEEDRVNLEKEAADLDKKIVGVKAAVYDEMAIIEKNSEEIKRRKTAVDQMNQELAQYNNQKADIARQLTVTSEEVSEQ